MNTTTIPSYALISYSRNKHGEPTGVLVAIPSGRNGDFNVGFSQCRKTDRFTKKMGLEIAIGRAKGEHIESWDHAPHNIRKMLPAFVKRCEKYYKVRVL